MKKLLAITLTLAVLLSLMSMATITVGAAIEGDFEYELIDGGTAVEITGYTGAGGDVTIPSIIAGKPVTSIGYDAFSQCTSLTSVTIPNSVTTIGSSAFWTCISLTSIAIPNSVTSIGKAAFGYCTSLTSITVKIGNPVYHSAGNCLIETETGTLMAGCKNSVIPSDGSVTSIGEGAFWSCGFLTSITIPNSVTTIGSSAFGHCTSLTSVTIPNSVTSIGFGAFYDCDALETIHYTGSRIDRACMQIGDYNKDLINATWVYQTEDNRGDANGDNSVDMKDVLMTRKFIANMSGATVDNEAADANRDGSVDMKDVLIIRRSLTF